MRIFLLLSLLLSIAPLLADSDLFSEQDKKTFTRLSCRTMGLGTLGAGFSAGKAYHFALRSNKIGFIAYTTALALFSVGVGYVHSNYQFFKHLTNR